MMTVLIGGVSPEGEYTIKQYINRFMPEASIEPIKPVGVKGMIKRKGSLPETVLIILEDSLYQKAYEDCKDVLDLPKVHRYTTDQLLKEYLITKFGKLDADAGEESTGVVPPDQLMSQQMPSYVQDDDDLSMGTEAVSIPVDDGRVAELEGQVAELTTKLNNSEILIRNLQAQLDDNSDNNEITDLVNTISELREKNAELEEKVKQASSSGAETDYEALGKVARAEQVIKEFDDLKSQMQTARENNSQLQHDKNELEAQVAELTQQVNDVTNKVTELEASLQQKDEEIVKLQDELEEKDGKLTAKDAQIQGIESEIAILQEKADKVTELQNRVTELQNEKREKGIALDNLTLDFEKMKSDKADLEDKYGKLNDENHSKNERILELQNQVAALSKNDETNAAQTAAFESTIGLLKDDVAKKNREIMDKEQEIEALKVDATKKEQLHQSELAEIQRKLEESSGYDEQISVLNDSINSLTNTNAELDSKVQELTLELDKRERTIKELQNTIDINSDDKAIKDEALNKALAEKSEIEESLATVESERNQLQSEIEGLKAQIESINEQHALEIEGKDKAYSDLEQEKAKLSSEIETLQGSLMDAQTDKGSLDKIENELLEERRKSARLSSEIEVLKKAESTNKSTELRAEITRLNEELKKAKEGGANKDEVEKLKAELAESRAKTASLETEMLVKDEELEEYSSGIFGQIANIAMPKVAYNINIDMPKSFMQGHIYCYASGSDESASVLFQTIKKSCLANPKARIIIFDLTTDSTIDRDFGIKAIKSPINWIIGSDKKFVPYLADTTLQNVKVLSTALAYMNDLFLLNIDWSERIEELSKTADAVIINVGCLNNLVSKILFNSFSKVMKSHIIVKATPINIRATILNITGYQSLSDSVTVNCVNFDNSSQVMYQKLASKCKATIIKDSDIIAL